MFKQKKLAALAFVMLITGGLCFAEQAPVSAAAAPVLKQGSVNNDVADLQFRLQTLGYYKDKISTTYGMTTRSAVINFQKANGIKADGIAGPQTWTKLKKLSVNKPELSKLARIIYSEARGEVYKGQVAVGAVVMNRLKSPLFPKSVTDIIFEPLAFTAVADGQYWLIPNNTAFLLRRMRSADGIRRRMHSITTIQQQRSPSGS